MKAVRFLKFSVFIGCMLKQTAVMSTAVNNNVQQRGLSPDPLLLFLKRVKEASFENFRADSKVHVVVGNEACDLDSTASAIAFAYYSNQVNLPRDSVHVPLLNIPRDDFPLRSDIKHVLSQLGISGDVLMFRGDVDLDRLHLEKRLHLSLVDFHVLPEKDETLDDAVINVIDHHKQEKNFPKDVNVRLKSVGSCATLVAARLFADNFFPPQPLVELIYSAIVADTICLSETAGKKTDDDEAIVRKLEELQPQLVAKRQKIFDDIRKARTDVSGLSTLELLRKDLKVIASDGISPQPTVVAISTIEQGLQVFLERPNVMDDIRKFEQERGVSSVILMFLSIDSEKRLSRQLGVYCTDSRLRDEICQVLLEADDPNLNLSEFSVPYLDNRDFVAYVQGNAKASRKAVLPIVKNSLKKLAKFRGR